MTKRNHATFSTPNTALAAYLLSEGFELASKDVTNPQEISFVFNNTSPKLSELVRAFNMGTAQGNITTFYYNYRKLVSIAQRERRLYGKNNQDS